MNCISKILKFIYPQHTGGNALTRQVKRAQANYYLMQHAQTHTFDISGYKINNIANPEIEALNKLMANKTYQAIIKRAKKIYSRK